MKSVRRPLTALTAAVALATVAVVGGSVSSTALFTSRTVNGGGAVSAAPDWTPPAVSLAHPGTNLRGNVTLNAAASDGETGVGNVTIAGASTGTSSWSPLCSIATAPWSCPINTATKPDGVYDLRATATDRAGYSASATVTAVRIDNTAPTGTLTVPAAPLFGTVSATATLIETGSGLSAVALQWAPTGTTAWSTAACATTSPGGACTLNTTGMTNGVYDLRARATDAAGNIGYTPVVSRQVNNLPTAVAMQEPGAYIRGMSTFTATATSNLGVTSVRIQRSASAVGPWTDICLDTLTPFECRVNSSTIPDGATHFQAVMVDGGGFTTTSAVLGPRTVDNSLVRGVDIQNVGNGNYRFGNEDVYLYTYSQLIDPKSLLAGWDGSPRSAAVRVTDNLTGPRGSDSFEVFASNTFATRFNLGDVEMNTSVLSFWIQNMDFEASIAMESVTVGGRLVTQVRLTVGAWRAGSAVPSVNLSAAQMIWRPSILTRDISNIATDATPTLESGTLDGDF